MSPRYYLISAVIVTVLTVAVSWWKQKKTAKEGFIVFGQVILLWMGLLGAVFGLAELLNYLGVSQSGGLGNSASAINMAADIRVFF